MDDGQLSAYAQSFVGHASIHFFVAALVLEIIFYGAFIVTFCIGTWLLLCRTPPQTRRQNSTIVLLVANTVMFLLSTTHFALDIYGATLGYFGASFAIEAAKFMIYVSMTLIGDSFMIYRLYRVFSRWWPVIILPTFLLLLDAIIGYTSTFTGIVGFYMSVAFYGISLFINVICTACILWRVFRLTREFQAVNNRKSKLKIWKVIEATVQSTAIYSAAMISLVITFVNSTELGYPTCLNIFPSLIALVFSFIVIRVALNARDAARPDSQFRGSGSSSGRTTYGSNAPMLHHGQEGREAMREVFHASPIETPTRERSGAGGDGVLVISKVEMDLESLESLPKLERGMGEAL
ncbi:hypothetical protein L226DRAFT_466444 [Lentinus tigrinus ALCF2SS1-7]|uniref:uncharacterized protein n=1 Tax=Lentinus tigrinus ALCF2SS1-7 TaxID=1328758 RepID=UPI0011663D20|nr:hypothetical protein L226DRAFT_466444 [Lentinus tigrinus ALCF2SS1-7]